MSGQAAAARQSQISGKAAEARQSQMLADQLATSALTAEAERAIVHALRSLTAEAEQATAHALRLLSLIRPHCVPGILPVLHPCMQA